MIVVRSENQLKAILGFSGITIDHIVNSSEAKEYIKQLWKYHCQIENQLKEKEEIEKKKYWDWLLSLEAEHKELFRKEQLSQNRWIFTKAGILARKVLRRLAGYK